MAVLVFQADIKEKLAYQGLFVMCSVSVAAMLSETMCHPRGLMARGLSWRPLQGTGEIAYGLYLWHWPVMLVVRQYVHWPIQPQIVLQIALTFPVALASYYWLERPVLRRFSPRFPRVTPEREERHRVARGATAAA